MEEEQKPIMIENLGTWKGALGTISGEHNFQPTYIVAPWCFGPSKTHIRSASRISEFDAFTKTVVMKSRCDESGLIPRSKLPEILGKSAVWEVTLEIGSVKLLNR